MPNCIVNKCKNRSNCNKKSEGITYHKIPCDPIKKEKWIDALVKLGRDKNWYPSNNTIVCSDHFHIDDFTRSKNGKNVLLKPNALPSYKKFSENNEEKDNIGRVAKKSRHNIDDIEIDYDNIDKFGEQIAFLLKRIPRQLCRELQDSIVTLIKTETEKYESKIKSNATEVEMLISTNIKQEAEEFTTEDELASMSDDDEIPVETTQATQYTETQLKTNLSTSTIKTFPKPMALPIELVGSIDCVKHEVLDAGESSNITVQEQYNKATTSGNVDCVNKEVLDPEKSRNITVEEEYNKATTSKLTLSDPLETRIKIEIDETSWLKQL